MPFELEALVGHLYIAGGRAINTTPPGSLVQTAPKNAARGRDVDTFFSLVLPSGRVVPTTFYEQMARMSAERYFSNTGSVTSALRDVFNTLNHNLYEHNQSGRSHYEAHMICAVLRDDELYIARSGAAVALLRYSGDTFTLPEDFSSDEKLFMAPLGTQPIPEVDMKRFIIDSGTRLLLVDAGIREVTLARITQAMVAKTLEDVLNEFKTLITLQTQLIATEFVIPERKIPVIAAEGEDSRALSQTITQARTNIQQEAVRVAEARRRQNPAKKIGRRMQQGIGETAKSAGTGMEALGDVAAKVFKRKQDDKPLVPTSVIITSAIALPLALVLVVVLSWVGGLGETRYDTCVENAMANAQVARGIDSSQTAAVVNTWEVVLANIAECQAERTGDPVIDALKREAQDTLDRINQVSRREAKPVAVIPGATIERMILQGTDLYVLDSALDTIYRVQLNTNGDEAIAQNPVTSMRAGAAVSGLIVGELVDMTLSERNVLALDVNGVLISCALNLITDCSAQQLNTDLLRNPTAIQVFNRTGNFYILDSGANQIWRYQPTSNLYPDRPREYFTGTSLPQLVDAVDFAITQDGDIYVLYGDGYMTRHRGGESLDFAFANFPPGQDPSDSGLQHMYLSGNLLPGLYLISLQTRSIFETGLIGTYHATYRVYDESIFERLSAVTVDPGQRLIYAGTGNAIYALRMDE
ncbi:hypothetical protein G4Y79_02205 [Phototrophicus methaneseepsis]|uniref:PPM-type phosphatase domain-containing protein n=1 Tax=Phototrophicus methaneseepsis TaxID=2710758 RepID=A0A7S8EA90_9CHLR|nr:hypothetical protein [Phototrophicus methaneseepsis]QPC83210.1 hypothetical protein G4Y79_02205 [Phototrophicus methaneseepsis]